MIEIITKDKRVSLKKGNNYKIQENQTKSNNSLISNGELTVEELCEERAYDWLYLLILIPLSFTSSIT